MDAPSVRCSATEAFRVELFGAGGSPDLFAAVALVHAQRTTRSWVKHFLYEARFGGTPATPNLWPPARREVGHDRSSPYT